MNNISAFSHKLFALFIVSTVVISSFGVFLNTARAIEVEGRGTFCTSMTRISSRVSTQTAGFTATEPADSAAALLPTTYSNGAFTNAQWITFSEPVWVNPNTNPSFAGSGALWISSEGFWMDGPNNTVNQWRLFQDTFTVPADATAISGQLYYAADNAVDVHLNGTSTPFATTGNTYGPSLGGNGPAFFNTALSAPFSPNAGANTLSFVVRNWAAQTSHNPTGLLYKAVISYCVPIAGDQSAPSSISGMKFKDSNRNGVKDASENGLRGWVIRLFLVGEGGNTLVATTTTDLSGNYRFENIAPGTYKVRETHKGGTGSIKALWKRMSKNPKDIVISDGSNVTDVNFGNMFRSPKERPDTDADDDRDDETELYYAHSGHSNYDKDKDSEEHRYPFRVSGGEW